MRLPPREYRELVEALIDRGYPKSPAIIEAFTRIDRSDFLPPTLQGKAYENIPLPVGFGQMTTEPFVVAFLLEQLEPHPGMKILDVGAGTGWQTALLAEIVGFKGRVVALEVIPELAKMCKDNLEKYRFANVDVIQADGSKGWQAEAPYDRIIVSAAVPKDIPRTFIEQLTLNGRLIIPVGKRRQSLHLIERSGERQYREKTFSGFAFPPLTSQR